MMRFTLPLLACAAAYAQQIEIRNPHSTSADASAGARIFRSHCAQCHGAKGTGGLGPNLTTGVFYHGSTDADLYRNITDGIGGTAMPGSFFDGTQAWQIVAYVRSISQTPAAAAPGGNSRHGEALFREKGCIGCHLVRGEGGFRGPELTYIGSQRSVEFLRDAILDPNANVSQAFWVAKVSLKNGASHSGFLMNEDTHMVQLLDFSKGLRSLPRDQFASFEIDKKSIMPQYKGKLNDQELTDLVSYLSMLRRQRGSE